MDDDIISQPESKEELPKRSDQGNGADSPMEPAPESIFDDLEALRKTAQLKVSRRVVPVNITVGRPSSNCYFRVHPDASMQLPGSVIIGDHGKEDFYYVAPRMLNDRVLLPRLRQVTIAATYTWPGGTIGLWPVPTPEESRIACWKTCRVAFSMAQTQWVQLIWNDSRRDYDLCIAEGISTEPIWPADLNLTALLKLGFGPERILDTAEHPYVRQLRGLAG
jgi:hypothetical protein